MKQVLIPLILVAAFITAVGLLTKNLQTKPGQGTVLSSKKELKIASTTLNVDVADSEPERQKGLGGRVTLVENEGMLFVFEQKDVFPSFWMKDMMIPIDIIWIDDGKIAKINKNVPIPPAGTSDPNLLLYRPDKPIDYVLEVNAGFSDKNKIKEGDSLEGLP